MIETFVMKELIKDDLKWTEPIKDISFYKASQNTNFKKTLPFI